MPVEVYSITITGNEDALRALAAVDAAAKGAGAAGASANQQGAKAAGEHKDAMEKVGDAFKKAARDVDVFGGHASAAFARSADDALGVVGALGGGGMLGATVAVSLAVAAGEKAWELYNQKAYAALVRAASVQKQLKEEIDKESAARLALSTNITFAQVREQENLAQTMKLKKEIATADLFAAQKFMLEAQKRIEAEGIFDGLTGRSMKNKSLLILRTEEVKEATERLAQATKGEANEEKRSSEQRARALQEDLGYLQKLDEISNAKTQRNIDRMKLEAIARSSNIRQANQDQIALIRAEADAQNAADRRALATLQKDKTIRDEVKKAEASLTAQKIANREVETRAATAAALKEYGAAKDNVDKQNAAYRAAARAYVDMLEEQSRQDAIAKANAARAREEDLHAELSGVRAAGETEEQQRMLAQDHITNATKAAVARRINEIQDAETMAALNLKEDRMEESVSRGSILRVDADMQMALEYKIAEEKIAQRKRSTDFAVSELDRQQQAVMRSAAAEIYASGVNTTFSVTMDIVGQSTQFAAGELKRFEDINRDNYRDMLEITPQLIAGEAKKTQAFLFNLGLQSGQKAIFETAEYGKEVALAFGSAATQDWGGAALHMTSAGAHLAAAAAYETIGGGAVGLSFGIGAMRGQGGPIQNVADAATGGSGGGGGSGSDPSASRGGGGGQASESGTTTVNITYGAGSVPPNDERRAARAVARGVRNARRDGFENRSMGA